MSRLLSTLFAVVCLSLPSVYGQVVGSAVGAGANQNLIGFGFGPLPLGVEPYAANPFSLEFTADTDVFGVESRATAPANFLDDSSSGGGDSFGAIKAADNDPFFGVVDTNNNDNPNNDPLSAVWTFDTSLNSSGLYLSMSFAAMGDFEATGSGADTFLVEAAFDGGQFAPVFESFVDDELPDVDYTLEDGSVRALADPLFLAGVQLSNNFTTLTAPLSGVGSSLSIRFSAQTDGGSEVVLFRNLEIHASDPGTGGQSGDFSGDGVVDAGDYTLWRDNFGQLEGDLLGGNGDGGAIGDSDYELWAASYGIGAGSASGATAAPEPHSAVLLLVAGLAAVRRRA
ncbi:hypothetical protein Pla123a_33990 [Posidoniimonas polymericola]|uniref:PEP-CTERM protein-sorting domain-containing protein n=1 Tax=Posidoniimonas polymericola TaxID=2528002 RepID=A0A5C5YI75_9BACT|nr:hypothetical protein [Posidoniimonas polymericola]TWT74575.1 hypothetical protein Pla123a_33990 [Posidoniimonas polymericola]